MNEFPRGLRPPEIQIPQTETGQPSETRQESVRNIAVQMEYVLREYGVETLQVMLAKMQQAVSEGRAIKTAELEKVIETRPSHSEFQQAALNFLEHQGYVVTTENGALIVDDERLFANFSLSQLDSLTDRPFQDMENHTRDKLTFLGEAFGNKPVLLKKDLANNPESTAKPLFYLPETREDALNLDKIKAADFHFGLWEIPLATKGRNSSQAASLNQPASLTRQTFLETSLAALVHHPKYGNAQRDQNGRLLVNDGGRMVELSGEWLFRHGLKFSHDSQHGIMKSKAKEMIAEFAPGVIERGLLRLQDFGIERSNNRAAETNRISSNGQANLAGVRHYLGRHYAGKSIRIDNIGPGLAALVEIDDNSLGQPTGVSGWNTPLGTTTVTAKIPIMDYSWYYGPENPNNYSLPNVKWNLRFRNHYYIHSAYWHNNFGHPMSHGCVNTSIPDAEWLYTWATVSTPVEIKS